MNNIGVTTTQKSKNLNLNHLPLEYRISCCALSYYRNGKHDIKQNFMLLE